MRRSLLLGILMVIVAVLVAGRAYAHSPHDDVDGLEISPAYAEDHIAYAVIRGNFFKTIDGGESWQRKVKGLDNKYGFKSLTISPQAENVLYMSSIGDGVYKSVDGGQSWTKANNQLATLDISQVVVAKRSPEIVLAVGNQSGLYRTADGGQSWQKISAGLAEGLHLTTVSFVAASSQRVYTGDEAGNLYVSEDLGSSWQHCCALPTAGAITAIGFSEELADDTTFLVGTDRGGVFKTTDRGQTFTAQNAGISSKYIQSVVFSPDFATDHTVYAVTRHQGIFRSEDAGARWSAVNQGLHTNPQALHYRRPSFSVLRIAKMADQAQTFFLSSFTGVYKSENRGATWQEKETLLNQIIVGVAIAPSDNGDPVIGVNHYLGDSYLIQGEQQQHLYVQRGLPGMDVVERLITPLVNRIRFGVDTSRLLSGPSRLHDVAFSPDFIKDQTAFISFQNYLLRTTDRGQSWAAINLNDDSLGLNEITGKGQDLVGYIFALSPTFAQDNTLFLGTEDGLILKSTDRGDTFVTVGTIDDRLTGLQISPNYHTDQTIFAASYYRGVQKSVDGSATWSPINAGLAIESGLLTGEIHLAISPNYATDQTLILGTVAGLFKSTDGGTQWAKVACADCDPNWTVAAVAISPAFQQDGIMLISVKGMGIFKSTDGGNTFLAVKDSLLDQDVSMGNLEDSPATAGALKFSPNYAEDQTVYGFSGTILVRSRDGGETWSIVANPDPKGKPDTQINLVIGTNLVYPLALFGIPLVLILCLVAGGFVLRRYRIGRARRQLGAVRLGPVG